MASEMEQKSMTICPESENVDFKANRLLMYPSCEVVSEIPPSIDTSDRYVVYFFAQGGENAMKYNAGTDADTQAKV